MHVRNLGFPLLLQIGGSKTTIFRGFRNLTANLTACILGKKRDIHNYATALATKSGLLRRLKRTWTLVHKWLKIGPAFLPTLRKFCIALNCQESQTEINKFCHMVDLPTLTILHRMSTDWVTVILCYHTFGCLRVTVDQVRFFVQKRICMYIALWHSKLFGKQWTKSTSVNETWSTVTLRHPFVVESTSRLPAAILSVPACVNPPLSLLLVAPARRPFVASKITDHCRIPTSADIESSLRSLPCRC